jgi:hypothetical protein
MEPGTYRLDVHGLASPEDAGRFAYNSMVVLSGRNDWVVKTGINNFVINGYQDGQEIFEVTYNYNPGEAPHVVLKGQFEGYQYTPKYGPQSSVPMDNKTKPSLPVTDAEPFRGLA